MLFRSEGNHWVERPSELKAVPVLVAACCAHQGIAYLAGMILTVGYFAEPSTPGARPANLTVANSGFVTHAEALATARHTADQIQAHSFVIDFPDGTTERHIRDSDGWRRDDA